MIVVTKTLNSCGCWLHKLNVSAVFNMADFQKTHFLSSLLTFRANETDF